MFLTPFIAGITTLMFGAGDRIVPTQCKEEPQARFLNEHAKPDELTALREALLGIVNDSSLKIAIRADAVKEIGRVIDLKDADIGKRPASVLSGDLNKLNLEICILLQTCKVHGVTPKIKRLAEKASEESDPICKAIADAIVNCSKETEKKDQHEQVSAVSNWLLLIAESKTIERELRIKALYAIGRIGEIASVPRLLRLLPGDTKGGDEETIAALDALASIGAPQVVAFLEKLDKTNDFHGRVRVALGSAIEKCSKGKTISARIRLLIRIATSEELGSKTRLEAIRELLEARKKAIAIELLPLLLEDNEELVLKVIKIISDSGDGRALFALRLAEKSRRSLLEDIRRETKRAITRQE